MAVVVTVVWGVLLLPGLLGAALSVMFFDAPGSMNNPAAWINAGIVASFPVLCVLSIIGSWLVVLAQKNEPARTTFAQLAVACLPLLPVVYFVGAIMIGFVQVLFSGQPLGLHSTIIKQ